MEKILLLAVAMFMFSSQSDASVLAFSSNGTYVAKTTLSAASTAADCAGKIITIAGETVTLSADLVWPADRKLNFANNGKIKLNGHTFTYKGVSSDWPLSQIFDISASGKALFTLDNPVVIHPEWYGGKADATTTDGTTGTDNTAAFAAAIVSSTLDGSGSAGGASFPIDLVGGNYMVGNIVIPYGAIITGKGYLTWLIAKPGISGKWITDGGSAAKVILRDFVMYGHGVTGLTSGIDLGNNGTQHGTDGYLANLVVRGIPNGTAINVNGNVGWYYGLQTIDSKSGIKIIGAANMCFALMPMSFTEYGLYFADGSVSGLEIEAPATNSVPIYLYGVASFQGVRISIGNSTTLSHLVEFGANSGTWNFTGFSVFLGDDPGTITVSNGNFKRSDGTYFGNKLAVGNANYTSGYFDVGGQRLQSFILRVTNTGGTIQHRITGATGTASNYVYAVNAASSTLVNTPTGTDSSTAFLGGGKISSAETNKFLFDVASQIDQNWLGIASIVYNDTTTAYTVLAGISSDNVNGTTRRRLSFWLLNPTTGAAVAWSSIPSGKIIDVMFFGFIGY